MSTTREPPAGPRGRRTAGAVVAVALGLAACSGPADSESSGVPAEDLRRIQDQVTGLEDRVTTLEDRVADLEDADGGGSGEPVDEPEVPAGEDTLFGDPESYLGQEVTVRGEVAELLASSDVASAFRIAGGVGEPVAVVSVTPPPDLTTGDTVEVSGTAVEVQRDTFERDFGIAADELFERPGAWFAGAAGHVAVAAVRIEVVQAPAGD